MIENIMQDPKQIANIIIALIIVAVACTHISIMLETVPILTVGGMLTGIMLIINHAILKMPIEQFLPILVVPIASIMGIVWIVLRINSVQRVR